MMNAKLLGWVGAILFLLAILLLFLSLLDLLPLLIFAIGQIVFVVIVAALLVGALILIVAMPYYFVTKRAEVQPGAVTLDQMKEP